MDIFSSLDCLTADGTMGPGQSQEIKAVAKSLPENPTELLKLIAASALAGGSQSGSFSGTVLGTQSVTSTDTVSVGTLTVPAGASRAVVSVHGNNIIFRLDGGTPALNTGHSAVVGSNFGIENLSDFKFISISTTDAILFVTYF